MLEKRPVRVWTLTLNAAKLLGLACLLLMTTQTAFAQTDPTVSIHDNGMFEGDTALFGTDFQVTLSAPSTKTISVQVSTQPGTATGGADFGEGSATVIFQPGQTSRPVQVFAVGGLYCYWGMILNKQ